MLPPGDRYYVCALEDANDNQRYDPGERLWIHGGPGPVTFTDGKSDMLEQQGIPAGAGQRVL